MSLRTNANETATFAIYLMLAPFFQPNILQGANQTLSGGGYGGNSRSAGISCRSNLPPCPIFTFAYP